MKDSINACQGQVLEQMYQSSTLRQYVSGKIAKAFAVTVVPMTLSIMGLMTPLQAQAQQNNGVGMVGCAIGGIVGGLLGSQFGGGNGSKVLTGAGAIAGCATGSNVQQNSQQPPQNYPNQRQQGQYPQPYPQQQGGQYAPGSHPMSSYAPACFAQWNGQSQPIKPLSPQANMALQKGTAQINRSAQEVVAMQNLYAQSYDNNYQRLQAQNNPYNNMNGADSAVIRQNSQQAQMQLNQIARQRQQAEMQYAADTVRILDACEYAASQGEDVRSYAHLQSKMTVPLLETPTLHHPITGKNIRIVTGGTAATGGNYGAPAQQAPSYQEDNSRGGDFRP